MTEMQQRVLAYLTMHPGAQFYRIDHALMAEDGFHHHKFRKVDAALQSLRRRGVVEYRGQKHGWYVVHPPQEGPGQ